MARRAKSASRRGSRSSQGDLIWSSSATRGRPKERMPPNNNDGDKCAHGDAATSDGTQTAPVPTQNRRKHEPSIPGQRQEKDKSPVGCRSNHPHPERAG